MTRRIARSFLLGACLSLGLVAQAARALRAMSIAMALRPYGGTAPALLNRLELPLLLIWGRQDRLVPLDVAHQCQRLRSDLPLVVLEAMAAGLPVVATRVGGVPEVVAAGEAGWLAEAGNPASLAGAMRAAACSDLAAAGDAAYRIAARDFGLEQ
ncbi:MAG: glycosyltransferase, partial [Holophagaceae bacterium]